MNTARSFYSLFRVIKMALVVSATAAALVLPSNTWAAASNTQVCNPGNTCVIGEFLYDDSYDPLVTATCTVTSRYPDGTFFLNSVSAPVSPEGDAWYSYQFTTPSTIGHYRTEIRCTTVEGDVLALDKSFEVKTESTSGSSPSANDIAAATWSYSNRSLSTFGSLVSDIWNFATRTITGAGLSSGSLATKSDVDAVSSKVDSVSSRVDTVSKNVTSIRNDAVNAIEAFVNNPIIEHSIEKGESSYELQTKIEKTQSFSNSLKLSVNYLKSKVNLVGFKWNDYKIEHIRKTLVSLEKVIGKKDFNSSSILGSASWIYNQWGWNEAGKIVLQAESINLSLKKLSRDIEYNGKSDFVYKDLRKLNLQIDELNKMVGSLKDTSKERSLFSKINETKKLTRTLDSVYKDVEKLLYVRGFYGKKSEAVIDSITKEVFFLNRLPRANSALSIKISADPERNFKNKVLALLGIIDANKKYLATNNNDAFSSTWLELGSIVFKTIITNPSGSISQTVPLRYDLPPEIKREHILEVDDGLEIKFDSEKNNYYISGVFKLGPNESKTLSVVADDSVFEIPESRIESLRKQAESLSEPLKNTSYFAQGVTLKTDIDVALDRILMLAKSSLTPEEKIRAFREAKSEFDSVTSRMEKLKELVTQAGSVGTFFGFVGGAQTLAVWGMIIIMVAGFVFLTLYMRQIRIHDLSIARKNVNDQLAMSSLSSTLKESKKNTGGNIAVEEKQKPKNSQEGKKNRFIKSFRVGVVIVGSFGILGGVAAGMFMFKGQNLQKETSKIEKKVASEVLGEKKTEDSKEAVKVNVFVPSGSIVAVYKTPSFNSSVLLSLEESQIALKFEEKDGWAKVKIELDDEDVTGWVDWDFIEEYNENSTAENNDKKRVVTVNEDLTGYLRVRSKIENGEVIEKVKAGDRFIFLSEKSGWIEIELLDGSSGWVSSQFVTITP